MEGAAPIRSFNINITYFTHVFYSLMGARKRWLHIGGLAVDATPFARGEARRRRRVWRQWRAREDGIWPCLSRARPPPHLRSLKSLMMKVAAKLVDRAGKHDNVRRADSANVKEGVTRRPRRFCCVRPATRPLVCVLDRIGAKEARPLAKMGRGVVRYLDDTIHR